MGTALKAFNDAAYPAKIGIMFLLGRPVPLAWALEFGVGCGVAGVGIALATDELVRGALNFRRWQCCHHAPHAGVHKSEACPEV